MVLKFFRRFSFLQQYFILLLISLIFVILIRSTWCILFLPLITVVTYLSFRRLLIRDASAPPWIFPVNLYEFFRSDRKNNAEQETDVDRPFKDALENECNAYIRKIIEHYIRVWYDRFISTNQDFPDEVQSALKEFVNTFVNRTKSLNLQQFISRVFTLQNSHVSQYLKSVEYFRKNSKNNRIGETIEDEFGQYIGFHPALVKDDLHGYLKAIVELFLTDLLPTPFYIYSASRLGREFLSEVLIQAIVLRLFNRFSDPNMLYYLITILWETEEQKIYYENLKNHSASNLVSIDRSDSNISQEESGDQQQDNNFSAESISINEQIIYSATIIRAILTHDKVSGASYTEYIIQCQTKSPLVSNKTDSYTVARRFREFEYLHVRLQENRKIAEHFQGLNQLFISLPKPIDKMNPEVIRQRRAILEQYIQIIINNLELNRSHDVLEFFAFNMDRNKPFDRLVGRPFQGLRFDGMSRAIGGAGSRWITRLLSRQEAEPLPERIQWKILTTYDKTAILADQLETFLANKTILCPSLIVPLNMADKNLLKVLLKRISIVNDFSHSTTVSDLPLTDSLLDLIYTCLNSRDTMISQPSVRRLFRTLVGGLLEKIVENKIDYLFSRDRILIYLKDLRTKILWPDEQKPDISMKNMKKRALNACLNKIPQSLQTIVGKDQVQRILSNALDCLHHRRLNQHFLCRLIDLSTEFFIPNLVTNDFLKKYMDMHAGVRV